MKDNILQRIEMPGSALQLAVLRICIGLAMLYASSSEIFNLLIAVGETQNVHTIFPSFFDDFVVRHVQTLRSITIALSVFLVLGLFTRFIAPVLFISFILLFSFYYRGVNAPIHWLYYWFPLLILCFCRCSDSLSLDKLFNIVKDKSNLAINTYRWPVELFIGWFVYIYFAAGLAKIFPITNFDWVFGGTSQQIIYYRFLDSPLFYAFGAPFFDYSAHNWFFGLLSTAALILELSCFLLLITKMFNLYIFVSIIFMHFFLFLFGVAGFGLSAVVLGIALIPPHFFIREKIN